MMKTMVTAHVALLLLGFYFPAAASFRDPATGFGIAPPAPS